jgi:putative ABC transport system substrate-binding protein
MQQKSLARFRSLQSDNLKSKIENLKWAGVVGILVLILGCVGMAQAQQPTKIPRVVWLTTGPLSIISARLEAFRQGLRELGYVEGKNISIEACGADNIPERRRALVEELVRLKVDVIVTAGAGGARAAKEATSTIPIVMASSDDPIGAGFVASLARPGGNIIGLSQLSPELSGKRLEILKEVFPKLSRLAVFGTSTDVGNAQVFKEIELAAAAFGVKLQYLDMLTTNDIDPAFRAAVKGRADAVLEIISGPIRSARLKEIAELAVKSRLPVMRERPEHCGSRRTHVLWRQLAPLGQARRNVCRQNPQRHEPRRSTH